MRIRGSAVRSALAALPITLALSSCVDEKTVFEERDLFGTPPSAAAGFLGYVDSQTKLVACGSCHVGQQAEWKQTAHAGAWETLQNSGFAQPVCSGCHTVNERGNLTDQTAGYLAVPDVRYHDVQCESCHGPGLTHIRNPDVEANQPLAPVSVGADLTTGCGECHQGAHHPFVEEWEQSPHGHVIASPAGRAGCDGCHEGKGALRAWGVDDNYLEKGTTGLIPIVCAVCHDPHGSENNAQLRFPIETASIDEHLCARCHNRRVVPDPSSSHGLEPHAPQAALLAGEAGWFPPGLEIVPGEIQATHGTERNTGLCATCHVQDVTVTDASGGFLVHSTGHLFRSIPCVDASGVPLPGDCGLSTSARSFGACATSGCHASPSAAFSVLTTATSRLLNLSEELHDLLVLVDPNLTEAGGEIDPANPTFTTAEGAFFNLALAEFPERDRPDARLLFAGSAAHNPFLMEQLLLASIDVVEATYGVSASPSLARQRVLTAR